MITYSPTNPVSSVVDALDRLNEIILSGWCQGAPAKDEHGYPVSIDSHRACQFCLSAAISKLRRTEAISESVKTDLRSILENEIWHGLAHTSILSFNDNTRTRKEDVLFLIKHTRDKIARY